MIVCNRESTVVANQFKVAREFMTSRLVCAYLLFAGSVLASCGSNPVQPSQSPLAGTWTGTIDLTSTTGSICSGQSLTGFSGASNLLIFTVSQAGDRLTTGGFCSYTGRLDGSQFGFTADASSCPISQNVRCEDGSLRDVRTVSASMSGTGAGNTAQGTINFVENVMAAGSATVVGTLTLNTRFNVTR